MAQRYRYARRSDETLVDVQALHADRGEWPEEIAQDAAFSCLSCDQPLIAKTKGEKRDKHFAHRHVTTNCSEETYLHRLGKTVFMETYRRCLETGEPYFIELEQPQICDRFRAVHRRRCHDFPLVPQRYDLTTLYDGISLETHDGSFVPDLLLSDSSGQRGTLYIEIAVTHFLSETKEHSGQRIIEIPLSCEEDLEKIQQCHLTEKIARFVGIARPTIRVPDGDCRCSQQEYSCLIVYESGKCFMEEAPLIEIHARLQRSKVHCFEIAQPEETWRGQGNTFKTLVERVHDQGFPIRNCYLCRYQGVNWGLSSDAMPIFCKVNKVNCGSNAAVNCDKFYLAKPAIKMR